MVNRNHFSHPLAQSCPNASEGIPLIEKQHDVAVALEADVRETESLGYVMLLLAAIFFCLMSMLTRYLGAYTSFSVPSLVFVRGVTQGLLSLMSIAVFLDFRTVFAIPRKYVPHVIGRGICGAANVCLNYKALSLVPLGITTSILFFHPILTMILSTFILGERIGRVDIIAAALSFVGVVLVSNPTLTLNFASAHSSGYVLGMFSIFTGACVLSCAIIIIRSIGKSVHYMSLVVGYSLCVTIGGIAMGGANLNNLMQDPKGLGLAVIAALFGFFAQSCFNFGFQRCRAGTGSVIRTIDVPLAFLLALIFLHEVPHSMSIVGSILVIAGVALIGLKQFGKK